MLLQVLREGEGLVSCVIPIPVILTVPLDDLDASDKFLYTFLTLSQIFIIERKLKIINILISMKTRARVRARVRVRVRARVRG